MSRQEFVERLKKLSEKPSSPFLGDGAMCYAIRPPDPMMSAFYSFLIRKVQQAGKAISTAMRGKIQEAPTPDKYQDVFSLLQDTGLDVRFGRYGSEGKQHDVMVIHFHGADDVILEPVPSVSTLETLALFLKGDTSVNIAEIEQLFNDIK